MASPAPRFAEAALALAAADEAEARAARAACPRRVRAPTIARLDADACDALLREQLPGYESVRYPRLTFKGQDSDSPAVWRAFTSGALGSGPGRYARGGHRGDLPLAAPQGTCGAGG